MKPWCEESWAMEDAEKNKIKVLHLITRLIVGGAQENTLLTADLLSHDPSFDGRYDIDIVSGPQTGPEGSLAEEARRRSISLIILPELRREISPYNDLRALLKLYRLMKTPQGGSRYQIIHTHSSKAGILGRLAARLAGVPVIIHTVHGWSFHDRMPAYTRIFYILLEKMASRLSHKMIAVSSRDIKKGLNHGIGRSEDYVLIRSGIELDLFGHSKINRSRMLSRLGMPEDARVVGCVTRLCPQKAPFDLIEAYSYIARRHADVWFMIVGSGPLLPQVKNLLVSYGIVDRTILTGIRRDVHDLMTVFDVFVLSSVWEGLPRVLPQAMATGLPVVSTDADGSAEAIRDGENGFLVPRNRPDALADKVVSLLEDRELRRRMGDAGRRLSSEFDVYEMVKQINSLYQDLLGDKST